jgi:hypothetical protein
MREPAAPLMADARKVEDVVRGNEDALMRRTAAALYGDLLGL